ncbi:hypothetical protein D3C81_1104940 [compost metagenome]
MRWLARRGWHLGGQVVEVGQGAAIGEPPPEAVLAAHVNARTADAALPVSGPQQLFLVEVCLDAKRLVDGAHFVAKDAWPQHSTGIFAVGPSSKTGAVIIWNTYMKEQWKAQRARYFRHIESIT